jgi:hypothetical protein
MSRFSNNRRQSGPGSGDSSHASSPRCETLIADTVMEPPNAPAKYGIQGHRRSTRDSTGASTLMPTQNSGTPPDISKPSGIRKKRTRQALRVALETIDMKFDGRIQETRVKRKRLNAIDTKIIEEAGMNEYSEVETITVGESYPALTYQRCTRN